MPREQRVVTGKLVREKSRVVYPGVDMSWVGPKHRREGPPVIIWPHRWEQDKNPQVFDRAVRRLRSAALDFGLVLAGIDSEPANEVRQRMLKDLADHVVASGSFDIDQYRYWVMRSDIVVSCTDHEFFGIAVVEALAAGCQPVLPNDFSYPELVDGTAELYEPGSFGSSLERAVGSFESTASAVDVARFDWRNRIGEYDELISAIGGQSPGWRSRLPTR
jgi:glycosyltransferase involved in cell wall biosynthesis